MTLSIKSGFDFGAGLQTGTIASKVTSKSASDWLITINDAAAAFQTIRVKSSEMPSMFIRDEFAYINTAPSHKEQFVHSTTDRTSWSDYQIEPTIHVVDRNELDAALAMEPMSYDVAYDDMDECCSAECDEESSLYDELKANMEMMNALMTNMQRQINHLESRVDHERDLRFAAEHKARELENTVRDMDKRVVSAQCDAWGMIPKVYKLEAAAADTAARVVNLEQLRSLTVPTATVLSSVDERSKLVDARIDNRIQKTDDGWTITCGQMSISSSSLTSGLDRGTDIPVQWGIGA